ncbi:tetraacyldisaccharide 4'-kinase [Bathymodiolus septemdierum thioautotrophic gill symbiont]|uniref:Tetraacyldisaccharide 4'-kinase n=1 Tax=endosymbiont of Bathymodiolus septemdierum str. Myojin knoll TaxID=1303921 RepID=A0A0P0USG3_9GAMM|nr:tetraacyldisaccharide 4'-kinase [Bathymodiolus septemdierum thioautotrophic gill symbiont]BAS68216.1 tetraacyldisaccharide 4'-kinase [endosymbiont of Bathymodiolus septemdierum str. Myojin knoll]
MDLNKRGLINYLLLPISAIFYLLSLIRKVLYYFGILKTHQFDVPVIVVGNITVGGTGKTPIVMTLVEYFKAQGKKVGVVSRGYGGIHQQGSLLVKETTAVELSGDEPLLIATQTGAVVMVNKKRTQAVQDLIDNHSVDIVISDDGLQHYAMGRAIEICVENGFGNGFLLPAGPLRESIARLDKVDFVLQSVLKPLAFINLKTQEVQPLDYFKKQTCHGVAGIGKPSKFFTVMYDLGVDLIEHPFADHHLFIKSDLDFKDTHPIIMTAKDCVKCKQFATQQMWYLQVEAELSGDFLKQLDEKI